VHHPELKNPSEIVVAISGEGEQLKLDITVPEGVRDQVQVLHCPDLPATGEAPEYVVCVSSLSFQCGAVLPETMLAPGRFFNEARFVARVVAARKAERLARELAPMETINPTDKYVYPFCAVYFF